jgi:hypothetical protein
MRKRFKAIIELISIASSVFAFHRETIAELEKPILAKLKGPLAKLKAEFKEAVKDVFGTIARIGR